MFEFATATRILFGPGRLQEVGPLTAALGRRVLVVGGGEVERLNPLLERLEAAGVGASVFQVTGELTVERVMQGVTRARKDRCDVILGLGGGSVLDAGKAIAALLNNPGEPLDYLEVVGQNRPLTAPSAPYLALPRQRGRAQKLPGTLSGLSPRRGSRSACAARTCSRAWRSSTLS